MLEYNLSRYIRGDTAHDLITNASLSACTSPPPLPPPPPPLVCFSPSSCLVTYPSLPISLYRLLSLHHLMCCASFFLPSPHPSLLLSPSPFPSIAFQFLFRCGWCFCGSVFKMASLLLHSHGITVCVCACVWQISAAVHYCCFEYNLDLVKL